MTTDNGRFVRQSNRLVRMSDLQQLQLVELNELKNKFVGMAAHDLRSPCSLINGFSNLMVEDPDMDLADRVEFTGIINQVSASMLRLLGDLLDVSAIESGKLTMTPVMDDVRKLVEERSQLMAVAAEYKNIGVKTEMDNVPDVEFDGDRLGQVIDNLISNAIKFSEKGTIITVFVNTDNGWVKIAVTDQGPGIPPDEINSLFGAFQKTSVRPTGDEKSTGLGLAIVKKIVAAHKGKIDVESKIGEGTTFTVSLPCGA
ncbi:MAG: HAMP domain-containing histidine kinase [Rhodospirillaceae bacterium]|nr:HAMP domain-containing histidine kinase [Rhodospirillales bacterium]MBT3905879.1 HAMP domain-containing histidine kinase [Rhodospirillaceae bacterium]MBT4702809.1 HAMP domain-containing histidine kinase [Rhodospirillaceae bacterium]MBT6361156.1 HAMP domain-containing histidine kinase [Rhodospirillaceae bacterium]